MMRALHMLAGSRTVCSGLNACPPRAHFSVPCATRRSHSSRQGSPLAAHALPALSALPSLPVDAPHEVLLAGAALTVALAGLIGWQLSQGAAKATETETPVQEDEPPAPPPLKRENAVLVLGATGRVGRRVVAQLVRAGRTVVAGVRSSSKAQEVFQSLGVTPGVQQDSAGLLFVEEGLDVTNPQGFEEDRWWEGVTQVVSCLGTVTGPLPGGGWGILDNMSPERVEGQGLAVHLASSLPQRLAKATPVVREVLSLRGEDALAAWERLDDVIMGGSSSSSLQPLEDGSGAVWRGDLVVEGGGFCGTRTRSLNLDLSDSDGLELCVRGDGQVFKFNIKTRAQESLPESTYQTTFDTVPDTWTTVRLPWHHFVPVQQAQYDPAAPPLNPADIGKLGLVLSRFEFNKAPNPAYKPGSFELSIRGGINAYRDVRPQVVMVSSAGVERNALIGDDGEARRRDIPIVQLNPAGTLNWKYAAEMALRAGGYPYCIVRATGMTDAGPSPPEEAGPPLYFRLEADQGDVLSGLISRDEVAEVVVAALSSPEAVGKTFEVRRCDALLGGLREVPMGQRDWLRLFLKLSLDRHRWRVGLRPFPKAVPPPAPVTEERIKEIVTNAARLQEQIVAKQTVTASASQ